MNVTIKDLPQRIHRKLKARASANKRSLNWEMIDILEKAVESRPVDIEELIADVDRLHAKYKIAPVTDEFLRAAKNEGRP
jgi:plasmid stability protein